MNDITSEPEIDTAPRLVLVSEGLAGGDLAYLLREVWRGRGLDLAKWEGGYSARRATCDP